MADFVMPTLGADMTEGTLVQWKKREGDRITKGEILTELQERTAIPGVLPTWLQPIQTRLVMLQTGFRAMMGVKIHDMFARKPGTTLAQFSTYWTGTHAPIAQRFTQIQHYTQCHRVEQHRRGCGQCVVHGALGPLELHRSRCRPDEFHSRSRGPGSGLDHAAGAQGCVRPGRDRSAGLAD